MRAWCTVLKDEWEKNIYIMAIAHPKLKTLWKAGKITYIETHQTSYHIQTWHKCDKTQLNVYWEYHIHTQLFKCNCDGPKINLHMYVVYIGALSGKTLLAGYPRWVEAFDHSSSDFPGAFDSYRFDMYCFHKVKGIYLAIDANPPILAMQKVCVILDH